MEAHAPVIVRIRGEELHVQEVTVNGGGVQARTDASIRRVPSYRRESRTESGS
jgi:hypothetical protein